MICSSSNASIDSGSIALHTPKKFNLKERVRILRGLPWLDHEAGWISIAQIEMNAGGCIDQLCINKTQPTHSRQ
jgi:hypothetical protein